MITYYKDTLRILEHAIESIDENIYNRLLQECETALKRGNSIIVSGLGKNVPICDKFVGSMISMGLRANFLHTNSAVHGDMGMIHPGDLVIILTKSGATSESVYLAELLLQRKVDLWLLSFEGESILEKKIKNSLIITMEHEGDPWNIMPNNSTTLNLIVLQGIAMELSRRMGVSLENFKQNHPGGHIGKLLHENGTEGTAHGQ